ncbi:MAG: sulfatase [Deltaproteobacteria bacterium]|nr:sulfatase [Deltaproteobacteria bacterium]
MKAARITVYSAAIGLMVILSLSIWRLWYSPLSPTVIHLNDRLSQDAKIYLPENPMKSTFLESLIVDGIFTQKISAGNWEFAKEYPEHRTVWWCTPASFPMVPFHADRFARNRLTRNGRDVPGIDYLNREEVERQRPGSWAWVDSNICFSTPMGVNPPAPPQGEFIARYEVHPEVLKKIYSSLPADVTEFISTTIISGSDVEDVAAVSRPAFIAPAGSRFEFPLELSHPSLLTFGIGLKDIFRPMIKDAQLLERLRPGPVAFEVSLRSDGLEPDGKILFQREIHPDPENPEKMEFVRLDLSPWSGRTVDLIFRAEKIDGNNDPEKETEAIHAGYWANPIIEDRIRSRSSRPNVILLVIDALRSDHLGCYGYQRPTSPAIDALAAGGVRFETAFCQSTWTASSIASLFTSSYPSQHGRLAEYPVTPIPNGLTTLAEHLRKAGYHTAAFATNPHLNSDTGFHRGFDEHTLLNDWQNPTDKMIQWIRQHENGPFFVYGHYMEPHSLYTPHEEYDFLPGYQGRILNDPVTFCDLKIYEPWEPFQLKVNVTPGELEKMIALYDGEIRYVDETVSRLISEIRSREELARKTLVIVTADHGEEFADHGWYFHGYTLFRELIDVPLIFSFPGFMPEGKTISTRVQLIDVMPTILDIAGIEAPRDLAGKSLLRLIRGDKKAKRMFENRPSFSETAFRSPYKATMIKGRYKVIWEEGTGRIHLFDLEQDPGGERDLAVTMRPQSEKLVKELKSWVRNSRMKHKRLMAASRASKGSKAHRPKVSKRILQRLKSLGYLQ